MNKLYLPSQNCYETSNSAVNTDEFMKSYIKSEFPQNSAPEKCCVYSVPRLFSTQCKEPQAVNSERDVFTRISNVDIPGLWCVFFHGLTYGKSSHLSNRGGKVVIREHDFVIFASYNGKSHVALVEVKSVSDSVSYETKHVSFSKMLKNSKRSGQHQLRDHLESIRLYLSQDEFFYNKIQSYIFWPYLSSNQHAKKWKDEVNLHVFNEEISDQSSFNAWFYNNVLKGNQIPSGLWNSLLERFITLSCGVFVDEICYGMYALLTQEQTSLLLTSPFRSQRGPFIIHGAAGTGKTFLIVKKLELLYHQGRLNDQQRALYICYWPGIKQEVRTRLESLGLLQYVDTVRFYIALDKFLLPDQKYQHIFVDEAEALCLFFEEYLMKKTLHEISSHYDGEVLAGCDNKQQNGGCFWFFVDINQAAIFLPKHSPNLLKTPDMTLNKIFRSTKTIFDIYKQFYVNPFPRLKSDYQKLAYSKLNNVTMAHNVDGPPIFWLNKTADALTLTAQVVIDLCICKGIKPNDICVFPFYVVKRFLADSVNNEIKKYFVEDGYMPQGVSNVEYFIINKKPNHFLIPWVLRTKGLEFKVAVVVIEDDDIDINDPEDRRKLYIMASRCCCLLIFISSASTRDLIDTCRSMQVYPLAEKF